MSSSRDNRTVFVHSLAPAVTEALLWELTLQIGPVVRVALPVDDAGKTKGFGFVEFRSEATALAACYVLSGVALFGQRIGLRPAAADRQEWEAALEDLLPEASQEFPVLSVGG